MRAAFARPAGANRRLRRFGWGSALAGVYGQVSWYRRHHIHLAGGPSIHPRVIAAAGTSARIADCVDDAHWIPIDRHGRSHAATKRPHRYAVTAKLRRLSGRWYVTNLVSHRNRTC